MATNVFVNIFTPPEYTLFYALYPEAVTSSPDVRDARCLEPAAGQSWAMYDVWFVSKSWSVTFDFPVNLQRNRLGTFKTAQAPCSLLMQACRTDSLMTQGTGVFRIVAAISRKLFPSLPFSLRYFIMPFPFVLGLPSCRFLRISLTIGVIPIYPSLIHYVIPTVPGDLYKEWNFSLWNTLLHGSITASFMATLFSWAFSNTCKSDIRS